MLSFYSGSARDVNADRGIQTCLEQAFGDTLPQENTLIIVTITMGLKLKAVYEAINKRIPQAQVLGNTAMAVVSKDGSGESMHEISLLAIVGPEEECRFATINGITVENSHEKGKALATKLAETMSTVHFAYLITPCTEVDPPSLLEGVTSVLSNDTLVFGGVASDTGKGLTSFQSCNNEAEEHLAYIVGFADPSLKALTRASHGFVAYGNPLTVTKASGKSILELDGGPAIPVYLSHIEGDPTKDMNAALSFGAMGEELEPALAEEYGNSHILRLAVSYDNETLTYPRAIKEGTKIWYTSRDEDRIFNELKSALEGMTADIGGGKPVAVFQTDCLARGRLLFDSVSKDELLDLLYNSFSTDGNKPAWLGMYGMGEFARLGGKDVFHNYTTAVMVFYRD